MIGIDLQATAWATFHDELDQTGWSRLYIQSNPEHADWMQATCAGIKNFTL
jgi:hypothetical protein